MIDSALQVWPNERNLLGLKVEVLQARGQLDEAQSILGKLSFDSPEPDACAGALFYQAWARRDPSIALKVWDAYARGPLGKDPSFLLTRAELQKRAGQAAEAQTAVTRARDILEQQLKEQPNNRDVIGSLAFALATLGERDAALKMLARLDLSVAGDARDTGTGHEVRARAFIRLGDKDAAIASLEKLLAVPSDGIFVVPVTPATLRVDPDFDSLHGDPRFEKLCQEKTK
jgi:tetratricopeptide (TPR) repeat protein